MTIDTAALEETITDKVWKYCSVCDEEFEVPEDLEVCLFCHKQSLKEI